MIHPDRPSWTLVNNFGRTIIQLLDGRRCVADIVAELMAQYAVPEQVLRRDLEMFLSSLEKTGIFHPADKDVADTLPGFENAFLHITAACNLGCRHCYFPQDDDACRSGLSGEAFIAFLNDFYQQGGHKVTISGGEPLLRMDVLRQILENHRSSHPVTVLSNGTLIDRECADLLKSFDAAVQISLDGSTAAIHDRLRGPGAFEAAMKGIEALKSRGLISRLNLCTTVTRYNVMDFKNIAALADEMGIPLIRFIPLRKEGRACRSWLDLSHGVSASQCEQLFDYVLDTARVEHPGVTMTSGLCGFVLERSGFDDRGHWCPIGRTAVIDTSGAVYPCVMLMDPEFRIGSILQDTIQDMARSPARGAIYNALRSRKTTVPRCRACEWRSLCQGGCMGLARHRYGTLWEPDEFCAYRKRRYETAIRKIVQGSPPGTSRDDLSCL